MSTTVRNLADDDTVDLVARTLRAVAEATPVTDAPARAPRGGDLVLLPPAGLDGRGGRRRARRAAMVAAAAAAVLVAGTVWIVRGGGDGQPTDMADEGASPPVHMEATWLPPALEGTPPVLERTPALDVAVDAAVWGAGDSVVVVAAIDLGDGAGPDRVQARTGRVASALTGVVGAPGADMPVTHVDGGRGAAVLAGERSLVDSQTIAAVVAAGTAPGDARPGEPAPRRLPVGWVAGVGPTVMTVHQPPDQSAALAVSTVGGTLPDAEIVEALVPGAVRAEVRGHAGWQFPLHGGDLYAVTWQEQPGVVVTVTGSGLRPAEIEAVAAGLTAVDEPVAGATGEIVATGTVAGRNYQIERRAPEETGRGWCAALTLDREQVGQGCQLMVDGATDDIAGLQPVASDDGGTIWWGAVPPGTATVTVDGTDVRAEAIEVAPSSDRSGGLRVAVIRVADHRELTFRFRAADGEELGTQSWSDGQGE